MKEVFDHAVFRCPFSCQDDLVISKFTKHLQHKCKNCFTHCPNRCDSELIIHVSEVKKHCKTCPMEPLPCSKCREPAILRQNFDRHLELECNYFTRCSECDMEIRVKDNHGLEECVEYLNQQVHELKSGII